jgi:DNA-binding LytR/AlgR family response regulator
MNIDRKSFSILVVVSEQAMANCIKTYLLTWGYQVVGIADCCHKARQLYQQERPDMTLIDIQLKDCGTGIDLAHFIQAQAEPGLFLYLGTHPSKQETRLVRETFPVGFVNKPILPELLLTNLEIAFYRYATQQQRKPGISLLKGNTNYFVFFSDILYLEADHIYVKVYTRQGSSIRQRSSLSDFLERLPEKQFVKTHRSFAVNVSQLNGWNKQHVYIQGRAVPVSRGRRKVVMESVAESA